MKYNKGQDLPLPSSVVCKLVDKKYQPINKTIKKCTISLQNKSDIKIDLKFIDDKRGYVISKLTEQLDYGNIYIGTIWKDNNIHPIDVEFEMNELTNEEILKQELKDMRESLQNDNADIPSTEIDEQEENLMEDVDMPNNYKLLIQKKKKEHVILNSDIPAKYKKLLL